MNIQASDQQLLGSTSAAHGGPMPGGRSKRTLLCSAPSTDKLVLKNYELGHEGLRIWRHTMGSSSLTRQAVMIIGASARLMVAGRPHKACRSCHTRKSGGMSGSRCMGGQTWVSAEMVWAMASRSIRFTLACSCCCFCAAAWPPLRCSSARIISICCCRDLKSMLRLVICTHMSKHVS